MCACVYACVCVCVCVCLEIENYVNPEREIINNRRAAVGQNSYIEWYVQKFKTLHDQLDEIQSVRVRVSVCTCVYVHVYVSAN